jgi:hypothetical protein
MQPNLATIGRVAGLSGLVTYNYGKVGEMKRNNTTYTPIYVGLSARDGANTSTTGNQSPAVQGFWTSVSNWGTSASNYAWSVGTAATNIWQWSDTLTRPVLRGFTPSIQGE